MIGKFLAEGQRGRLFGPHLDSFTVAVTQLGYASHTVRQQVLVVGELERWLERRNLALVDLDMQIVKNFLEQRRRQGRLRKGQATSDCSLPAASA